MEFNEEPIRILAMTVAHVPGVLELWEATEGLILTDTDNVEDLAVYFDRNPECCRVAMQGDRLVGAVLCGHDGRRATCIILRSHRNFDSAESVGHS